MLRLVFHLALRQAEGFVGSVLRLLGLDLAVPDHTTLSRRSRGFAGRRPSVVPHGPMHLVIDSTGLKLFGQGEWQEEKHGRARRSWRKLHLALDADTGEIVASILTDNDADDAGQVPGLLDQVEGEIASVTADGAYDGEPVYQAVASRQPGRPPTVVIPPRSSAVPSATGRRAAEPARSPHPAHPQQGSHGLAEGHRLRPPQLGRDRHRPLQDGDRPEAARPHVPQPARRSRDRRRGAQPDDPTAKPISARVA